MSGEDPWRAQAIADHEAGRHEKQQYRYCPLCPKPRVD